MSVFSDRESTVRIPERKQQVRRRRGRLHKTSQLLYQRTTSNSRSLNSGELARITVITHYDPVYNSFEQEHRGHRGEIFTYHKVDSLERLKATQ